VLLSVMKVASSEARKAINAATSPTMPMRANGKPAYISPVSMVATAYLRLIAMSILPDSGRSPGWCPRSNAIAAQRAIVKLAFCGSSQLLGPLLGTELYR
jgi:hypothetical protein